MANGDTQTQDGGAVAPPTASPVEIGNEQDVAGRLWALVDTLVPESTTTITDYLGRTYVVPSDLPGRQQVRVIRRLRDLLVLPQMAPVREALGSGDVGRILDAALDCLEDEQVAAAIDEVFDAAFPGLVPDAGDRRPLDLFPVQEIALALLPFAVRLVRRIGGVVQAMGAPTPR